VQALVRYSTEIPYRLPSAISTQILQWKAEMSH
jgi:hypothetical protein